MRVLMVCLGNICRSPLAQGILEAKIKENNLDWIVDSAGTNGWHDGESPDPRSIEIAKEHGIDISHQVSRKVKEGDFDNFDLILAMDTSNYNNLRRMVTSPEQKEKVRLILNYGFPGENRPVPDPYFDDSFERAYTLIDKSCNSIIEQLVK